MQNLCLLRPDLFSMLRVDGPKPIRLLNKCLDFIFERCKVSFESIVLSLECLDTPKVLAKVIRRQQRVFLVDPGNRLISVAIEPKRLIGV